jgi:hypothetical protein
VALLSATHKRAQTVSGPPQRESFTIGMRRSHGKGYRENTFYGERTPSMVLCMFIVTCLENKCARVPLSNTFGTPRVSFLPWIFLGVHTTTRYVQDPSAPVFCPKDRDFLVSNRRRRLPSHPPPSPPHPPPRESPSGSLDPVWSNIIECVLLCHDKRRSLVTS